ncbi:hypothetical protein QVD17_26810 [Tagetes erecta]|uniref:Uncharacterized protein n=1 Tax=Tagetes erecta TaxID=13708 RepID=A0AAD8NR58_TARER|nr:hypothetical protein QVD17_26810 [Tagetes erecta]
MEALVENSLYADVMRLNNCKISTLTPELQFSPLLAKLFLEENSSLTMLTPSFFHNMPVLRVLDLSHTSIQSLPSSISMLCSLEEFILRDCSLLIELPPEIRAFKKLKLFDLEGTEIMYLPKEIGELKTLECLRVCLSAYADDHKGRSGIRHIIPRMTILKLTKLKELSISVSPEAEWWEVELLEAIMGDLIFLSDLKTLKLYLPTDKALQQFLRLERYKVPIYSSLWNYRFMTGHCEELPFSVQLDAEKTFLKLEKCVKYMNGEGYNDEIVKLVRDARALYLRRHWTIEKLSMFDIRRLKYCLLMECNEMQTLVDQEDFSERKSKSNCEGEILGSLQYLSIHFLKKLQRISKGPIGRNSLSCLRILSVHTCPELTSIFTESLLDNLQNLTEIIVEDCPKVKCLVKLEEGASWNNGPFLPKLKRVSLIDLPELVSVSGGVCIAPQLDILLVFNCMRLDYLSVMEIPRDTVAIKGEIEWWDALKYGKLTWESVFVQLKRDGSLMDQLAEDTNSLQHFLELEMDTSLPGIVDQNSSRDVNEDIEHVYQLRIGQNANLSNKTRKMPNQAPSDDGYVPRKYLQNESLELSFPRKQIVNSKLHMKVSKRVEAEDLDDGYVWRKYGQKEILGSKYPRSYYRCNFKHTHGCCAVKQVQRLDKDPSVFEVTYRGNHACPTVLSSSSHVNQNSKDTKEEREHVDQLKFFHTVELPNKTRKMSTLKILNCNNGTQSQYAGTAFRMWEPPSLVDSKPDNNYTNCIFNVPNHKLASKKNKSRSVDIAKWIQQVKGDAHDVRKYPQNEILNSKYQSSISRHQVKVNKGIEVEKALDDGYIWQKYGEKSIFGSKYPRAYYRCSFNITKGCCAKKHVQRSTEDPSIFDISYQGHHSCHTVLSNNCSSTVTESACTTLKTRDSSTATEPASIIPDRHFELAKQTQVLDSNKKKNTSNREAKWTQELQVSPNTGCDMPPDDGYVWMKYGQRGEIGATYYKCHDCNVKKRIQRSDDDPLNWIVTYKGTHTCLRLSITSDSTCESESALSVLKSSDSSATIGSELRIRKNSGSSTTAESTSTITDNSFGLNFTKKMSGSASIQRLKQQTEEIQSPYIKYQLSSSYEPNMIISEAAETGSTKLSLSTKTSQNAKQSLLPVLKVRKETLGEKIAGLQQLVSPFGKTDTPSVLLETCHYIRSLHEQVKVLTTPYIRQATPSEPQQQAPKQDLRSRDLCLVPVSSIFPVTNQPTVNTSNHTFGEPPDEPNVYI